MSDVSKTNGLIAELREYATALHSSVHVRHTGAELIERAADALEAATRVPVQVEPNDDREALRDEFRSYLGDEIYVSSRDHSAWEHGTMGLDDFSLAAEDDEIVESLVQIASRSTVPDDDPCDAEIHSWDHFRPEQIDSYWIRCTRIGRHDEHYDSNTGLRWEPIGGDDE